MALITEAVCDENKCGHTAETYTVTLPEGTMFDFDLCATHAKKLRSQAERGRKHQTPAKRRRNTYEVTPIREKK